MGWVVVWWRIYAWDHAFPGLLQGSLPGAVFSDPRSRPDLGPGNVEADSVRMGLFFVEEPWSDRPG